MPRGLFILLVVALAIAVTGLVWAAKSAPTAQPGGKATATQRSMAKQSPAMGEYNRCTRTCNTLMDYYHKTYTTMKTHEGDRTCWSNCWTRFGKGKSASVNEQKTLWTSRTVSNMRANQCSQACWRTHHKEARVVSVAGWRSEPRPSTVCYR